MFREFRFQLKRKRVGLKQCEYVRCVFRLSGLSTISDVDKTEMADMMILVMIGSCIVSHRRRTRNREEHGHIIMYTPLILCGYERFDIAYIQERGTHKYLTADGTHPN